MARYVLYQDIKTHLTKFILREQPSILCLYILIVTVDIQTTSNTTTYGMELTRDTNLMQQFIITNNATCFGQLYSHLQEYNK